MNSWSICDWLKDDCFWRNDKQVIIESKAAPALPTSSASDVITVSLGYAHVSIFCCWLSGNQTASLAPTQTLNLDAFLPWHLMLLNYNVPHSEKLLFQRVPKLCMFSPSSPERRRNLHMCLIPPWSLITYVTFKGTALYCRQRLLFLNIHFFTRKCGPARLSCCKAVFSHPIRKKAGCQISHPQTLCFQNFFFF